jgi:hypothetical protein
MAATTWIPAAVPAVPAARPDRSRPRTAAPLRVVPAARRRRLLVLVAGAVLVAALGGLGLRAAAAPEAPAAAGHVVLAPGETLWEVAVRTAAPGVDPRAQLRDLVLLNDLDPAVAPAAWTVVLLPAR